MIRSHLVQHAVRMRDERSCHYPFPFRSGTWQAYRVSCFSLELSLLIQDKLNRHLVRDNLTEKRPHTIFIQELGPVNTYFAARVAARKAWGQARSAGHS